MALPKIKSPLAIVRYAIDAARHPHSKPILRQLREMFELRFSRNQLGLSEYFDYALYDSRRFPGDIARTFIGNRVDSPLMRTVNTDRWRATDEDKLLFYTLMKFSELPHPFTRVYYGYRKRPTFDAQCITDPQELMDYLRTRMVYPFFSKPVDGYRGEGAAAVREYRRSDDSLILFDGSTQGVVDFVNQLPQRDSPEGKLPFRGHLFQELLRPSQSILDIFPATGLSTLRMVLLCDTDPPEVFRVSWKIPLEGNVADNFLLKNNVLVDVDPKTGILRRAIRSLGDGYEPLADDKLDPHQLIGRRMPGWDEAVDACKRASYLFPETPCQHWDVAICDQGAILVELNAVGDFSIIQSATPTGLLDERFETFLRNCSVELHRKGPRLIGR